MASGLVKVLVFIGATALSVLVERMNAPGWVLLATVVVCYGLVAAVTWWPRWRLAWEAFWRSPSTSRTPHGSDSELRCRTLERYFLALYSRRQIATDGLSASDLDDIERQIELLRGNLINMSPALFSTATAIAFQRPALVRTDQRERVRHLVDHLLAAIHQKWVAYRCPEVPTLSGGAARAD